MSPQTLADAIGIPRSRAELWADHLTAAMEQFDISTPARQAAFLAQVAHESALLTALSENLNYSAEGLLKTWPKRFTPESAALCARNPEYIANVVYGSRMGNTDQGDGWKFRGAGLIQLTGRENQTACAKALDVDPEQVSDWLRTPEGAAKSAGWFWQEHALNQFADAGAFEKITRIINGGVEGLPHRMALYQIAMKALT